MTIPKAFPDLSKELIDFMFKSSGFDSLKIILWKIKNYDESYIG